MQFAGYHSNLYKNWQQIGRKQEVVMINGFRGCSRFVLILMPLIFFLPFSAQAQSAGNFVTLVPPIGLGPGQTERLSIVGGSSSPYVVPTGMALVITDYVFAPQAFPPSGGEYLLQINSQPAALFTTQMSWLASSAEPSSFQVHMTTGMEFKSGASVAVSMAAGSPQSVNFYAYGYLIPK
jgi:hypothetical protein